SEVKTFQVRQYQMAIKTYDAMQAANNNKPAFLRNRPDAPVSPPNHFFASPPDYTYRPTDKYKAEIGWQNYLRNHGYNEDATPTAATRLMQNKTFNKFADNIALPTLEMASMLDGVGEIKAALKSTSSLLKSFFKSSKSVGGVLDGINATVEGITARRVLMGDPEKIAVIGRDMERVDAFAKGLGAETWKGYTPLLSEAQNIENNAKWAKEIKDRGYTVFDIGLDDKSIMKYNGNKGEYYNVETKIIFDDK
ncbi:MAG TPA: hypothetical protein PLS50_08290, partial [Candidatus Dojkabacteria bacterium]|nr:hypothetical protein [Candidatus Dojkabacteria bacterium]